MGRSRELGKGWKDWGDAGVGFSLTRGDRKADIFPDKRGDIVEWRGLVWTGDDKEKAHEVWAATHWDAAAAVEGVM